MKKRINFRKHTNKYIHTVSVGSLSRSVFFKLRVATVSGS